MSLHRFLNKLDDFRYKIKWFFQRLFRGYSDIELWNLDDSIIKFTLPRLKAFRDQTQGYPSNIDTFEEWQAILDEMIWAMEYVSSDEMPYWDLKEKYGEETDEDGKLKYIVEFEKLEERARKGFEYFGKYFNNLWW